MRHRVAGKHLNRTSSHRKALRRNQAASLFQHGAIRTTEPKAKELRRFAEKLITLAKVGTLHARRRVIQLLQDRSMHFVRNGGRNPNEDIDVDEKTVIQKLFDEIAPKYKDRPGGYTRIIRLADRRIGDAGKWVLLQLVEETAEAQKSKSASRRKEQARKRHHAADQRAKKTVAPEAEPQEEPEDQDVPVDEEQVPPEQAEESPAEPTPEPEAEESAPAEEKPDAS